MADIQKKNTTGGLRGNGIEITTLNNEPVSNEEWKRYQNLNKRLKEKTKGKMTKTEEKGNTRTKKEPLIIFKELRTC